MTEFTPTIGSHHVYKVNIDNIKTIDEAIEIINAFDMTIACRGEVPTIFKELKEKNLIKLL